MLSSGEFILVWLRRSLCAYNNPAIDVGISLSNEKQLPLLVYSQVSNDEPYINNRLAYFALGANKLLAKGLKERNIQHCFVTNLGNNDDKNESIDLAAFRQQLFQRAACIALDQHFTAYEKKQVSALATNSLQKIVEVDATRLVPHSQFSKSLHVTKTFRAAHSPLRKEWYNLREDAKLTKELERIKLSSEPISIATFSDKRIQDLVNTANIDHSIAVSSQHPPTHRELKKRLARLPEIVKQYRAKRNNPAIANSTSQLSPYLHFGMTSVFAILKVLEESDVPKAAMWKFLDELITWREWSHWRLAQRPDYIKYDSLPNSALKTLNQHKDDPREQVLTEHELFNGLTPDPIWNAAQLCWRHTGWLHNNLRMYWATQFLAWTSSPEQAWQLACKFNDCQSLDGQDPACYISMRWAFGEAKPAYKERPVYGWIARKTDRALRKRAGVLEWVDNVLQEYAQQAKV